MDWLICNNADEKAQHCLTLKFGFPHISLAARKPRPENTVHVSFLGISSRYCEHSITVEPVCYKHVQAFVSQRKQHPEWNIVIQQRKCNQANPKKSKQTKTRKEITQTKAQRWTNEKGKSKPRNHGNKTTQKEKYKQSKDEEVTKKHAKSPTKQPRKSRKK